MHDLDTDAGVPGEVERAVHRLLLDERRARLVVGERVMAALGGAVRATPGLQQRVALGVHEHEPADGLEPRACRFPGTRRP